MYNFNPAFSVPGCVVTLKDLTEEVQGMCKSKHLNHCSEFTETAFFRIVLTLSKRLGKDLRPAPPELTHHTKTRNETFFLCLLSVINRVRSGDRSQGQSGIGAFLDTDGTPK